MTRTIVDVNAIYEDATTCVCGALVEELDSGNGHLHWSHVKRMRIEYDHAAVPVSRRGSGESTELATLRHAEEVARAHAQTELADELYGFGCSLGSREGS